MPSFGFPGAGRNSTRSGLGHRQAAHVIQDLPSGSAQQYQAMLASFSKCSTSCRGSPAGQLHACWPPPVPQQQSVGLQRTQSAESPSALQLQ